MLSDRESAGRADPKAIGLSLIFRPVFGLSDAAVQKKAPTMCRGFKAGRKPSGNLWSLRG